MSALVSPVSFLEPVSFLDRMSFSAPSVHVSQGTKLSRHLVLIGALSLGSLVGAQAHPLDSPETIYVDGVPCNSACQSYMAWSRKTREGNKAPVGNSVLADAPTHSANRRPGHTGMTSATAPKRVAPLPPTKEVIPVPRQAPRSQTAGLEYLIPEDQSVPAKTAAPEIKKAAPDTQAAAPETQTAALIAEPAAPETKAAAPASLGDKMIEEQILAATVLADHVTAASTPAVDEKKEVAENSGQIENVAGKDETKDKGDTKEAATASSPRLPDLVVLILARADIKSIADLANKDIAIEGKQAPFREQIRTGIAAAGAPMVELRDGKTSAIDRLVSGEQPAAILTLASPEAADWFPEIKGFRTFRIPLSPS